jgi:hypothetical protein
MSRKHFNAIAKALANARNSWDYSECERNAIDRASTYLAEELAKFNSSFNRQRFLQAAKDRAK